MDDEVINMSIHIGDKNKIKNSVIAENSTFSNKKDKKSWAEKHPVIIGIIVAVIAGVILELAFWDQIVGFINKLFGA